MQTYDNVQIAFDKHDNSSNRVLHIKIYCRTYPEREWYQANITVNKKQIKPIGVLSEWQKVQHLNVKS